MVAQRQELQVRNTFSFTPTTLKEAQEYAGIIANSGICPESFRGRPNDVLIVLQLGNELGLKPMQALRSLGSINGMPFAYGDGLLALVKRHSEFDDMKEWTEGDYKSGTLTAYCTMMRKGKEPVTQKFSIDDAKLAGLWNKKGPWQQYPQRMLQHRARSFAARDAFPDALFGLMSEDEARNVAQDKIVVTPPKGKGMQGLEASLGITDEPETEAEFSIINTNQDEEFLEEEKPIDQLKRLIKETATSGRAINGWLKKANVSRLEDLNPEHIQQGIEFLKTKETK